MTDKFEFIDAEYAAYQESDKQYVPSIVKMCIWMEVSRSGFYEWRNAPESATAKRRGELALYVKKSFDESDGTYGYRRVTRTWWPGACPPGRSWSVLSCASWAWNPAAQAVAVQPHRGRRPGARHPGPRAAGFHCGRSRRENGR